MMLSGVSRIYHDVFVNLGRAYRVVGLQRGRIWQNGIGIG